ncbi:flagellar basal-body rod protein FlgF [Alphaproteobacteria bacterium AO1-B]|jgi:flagellar basal-body rod protein FlgF|nr:flagellar basal-body rod protein FlgF [Alphaproteobacteria bacterium AO1-B]
MENVHLIGLSRQSALRNQLDVVANNMANINTTGFKSQRLLFEEYLMPVAEATEFQTPDETLSYVLDYQSITDFDTGAFKMTGNDLDLAIEGEGFFVVQMGDGTEAYTRDGAFVIDQNGQLVTSDGRPVLTTGGPITFSTEDGSVEIAKDGTISTELGIRGVIRVASFEDPQELEKQGDNLYRGENPGIPQRFNVVQGALERSNVEGVYQVTQMIEVTRAYESITKMLKDVNDLRQQAIQVLGKLEA